MELNLLRNLIDPIILFFVFGVFAGAIRSNLEIPPAIAKFFSLYLLIAIGLKAVPRWRKPVSRRRERWRCSPRSSWRRWCPPTAS